MKRIIYKFCLILIVLLLVFLSVVYHKDIYRFYIKHLDSSRKNIAITNNAYTTTQKVKKIKLVDNFIATDKNHLFNIYYTIINSGVSTFTFYCDIDYKECINDVNHLSTNTDELSMINDFVHPYNSFNSIKTTYTSSGEVTLEIEKKYQDEMIKTIDNKVTSIINKNITQNMSDKERIKVIHDYIINNTKYDEKENKKANSNIAYGVLLEGIGMCGGYSDAMSIILHQLNINNFKISNEKHVWNYVELNNQWYHLDLTWDDPVTSNGSDLLKYYYYLINDTKLSKLNTGDHNYDKTIYEVVK